MASNNGTGFFKAHDMGKAISSSKKQGAISRLLIAIGIIVGAPRAYFRLRKDISQN
jgi:hypothetical protein